MRRTYALLIAVVLSTAATTVLVLHALGITNTGVRLEFQTISKGAWSGHTSHAYYVIQDMRTGGAFGGSINKSLFHRVPLQK